jgi:hypothetical protein
MKLVVAKVQGGIDRFERFEIDVDLSFLALRGQDFTTIYDQAIRGNLVIELQALLGRGNGRKDGLPIDSGLDVRCRTLRRHQQRVKDRRKWSIHILQPTSSQPVKLDPLGLHALVSITPCKRLQSSRIMREIMEVPFPRAASKRLMSFFTFQISIFFSASLACASLISAVDDALRSRFSRALHDRCLTLQGTESRSFFSR